MLAEGPYTSFLSSRADVRAKKIIFVKYFESVKPSTNGFIVFFLLFFFFSPRCTVGDLCLKNVRREGNRTRMSE